MFFPWNLCTKRKAGLFIRWVDIFLLYSFSSNTSVFTPGCQKCRLHYFMPLQIQGSLLQVKCNWCELFTLIIHLHLDESGSDHRQHIAHRLHCLPCNTIVRPLVEIGGSLVPSFSCSLLPLCEGMSLENVKTLLSPREFSLPHPFLKNELGITYKVCMKTNLIKNRNPFNLWTKLSD